MLEGGDILKVAGRRLEVHYTPGHAVHHVIFFDVHSGELFAGDVGGVRLPGVDYVRPPTPPPDLDLEAWSESIDLVKSLRPDVLYIAHFGAIQRHRDALWTAAGKALRLGRFRPGCNAQRQRRGRNYRPADRAYPTRTTTDSPRPPRTATLRDRDQLRDDRTGLHALLEKETSRTAHIEKEPHKTKKRLTNLLSAFLVGSSRYLLPYPLPCYYRCHYHYHLAGWEVQDTIAGSAARYRSSQLAVAEERERVQQTSEMATRHLRFSTPFRSDGTKITTHG